jgi:membrane protease YdiL (CAAX protease family)
MHCTHFLSMLNLSKESKNTFSMREKRMDHSIYALPHRADVRDQSTKFVEHGLAKSIWLHLLPGVLMVATMLLTAPLLERTGLPVELLVFVLPGLLCLAGFQLGYLFWQGKRLNGKFSLRGVVAYRQRMPIWQLIVLGLILFSWVALIWQTLRPAIDRFFIDTLFYWMPDMFFQVGTTAGMQGYPQSLMWVLGILFTFTITTGAAVEELYFRGYLLPRMERLGIWAPLLHTLLFSLYHFWSPWQNVARILAMTPLWLAVWYKRNIYLGILVHCAVNLISGMLLTLSLTDTI